MKATPTRRGFGFFEGRFAMEAQANHSSSSSREKRWAAITIVCPNGDKVSVVCTGRTTRIDHDKKGKR